MENIDTSKGIFREKAYKRWGKRGIKTITFGKVRRDGTRSAKIEFVAGADGHGAILTFSYLTDLSIHVR